MGFAVSAATTASTDIGTAVSELHDVLGISERGRPDFIAVHASLAWDMPALQEQARRVLAGSHLHGGTTCLGVMGKGGARILDGTGLGAFAIWDPEGDFGVASAHLSDNPRADAAAVTRAALADAGREGEAPELIWLTVAPGREEEVVAGIMDVVGSDARILGGSAADNDVAGGWRQYCHSEVFENGIVLSVLFPSRSVSLSCQNGYVPGECCGTATHAEGRRLYRIDDRPAMEVYGEWAGDSLPAHLSSPPETSFSILEHSAFVPFGRQSGQLAGVPNYLLALPAESHPDGSMSLLAEVGVGQQLQLMRGSPASLVTRAGRVARHAAEHRMDRERPIAGALMVFCGGLTQIILNLAINARDALPTGGGRIEIALRPMTDADRLLTSHVGTIPRGSGAVLSVRDDGSGIAFEDLQQIFQPFFSRKGEQGSGLGLSVVAGILKSSGGGLSVRSDIGAVAEFLVFLPLDSAGVQAGSAPAVTAPATSRSDGSRLKGLSVLVADDNLHVLEMLTGILEHCGAEPGPSINPADALHAFTADPDGWDLLVTDYDMPEFTGAELARSVRRIRPDIPILLCTALPEAHRQSAADLFDAVVGKPVAMESFIAATEAALAARAERRQTCGS